MKFLRIRSECIVKKQGPSSRYIILKHNQNEISLDQ